MNTEDRLRDALAAAAALVPADAAEGWVDPASSRTRNRHWLAIAAAATVLLLAIAPVLITRGAITQRPGKAVSVAYPRHMLTTEDRQADVRDTTTGQPIHHFAGQYQAIAVTDARLYLGSHVGCNTQIFAVDGSLQGSAWASPRLVSSTPGGTNELAASADGRYLAVVTSDSGPPCSAAKVLGLAVSAYPFKSWKAVQGWNTSSASSLTFGPDDELAWLDRGTRIGYWRPGSLQEVAGPSANLRHPPVVDMGWVDNIAWTDHGTLYAAVEGAHHSWLHPEDEYRLVELNAISGAVLRTVARFNQAGWAGLSADSTGRFVLAVVGGQVRRVTSDSNVRLRPGNDTYWTVRW